MKTITAIFLVLTSLVGIASEPEISVAYVHPQSKEILVKHGGKVPKNLKSRYRLLFQHNSGEGDEDIPHENGLLVSIDPIVDDKDFIGFETLSTCWGNLGGVIHLRIASRTKVMEFLEKNTKGTVALVIDGKWVFYQAGLENVTPKRGFIAIPFLDRYDELKFKLLCEGKRGAEVDKACQEQEQKRFEGVPVPTLKD